MRVLLLLLRLVPIYQGQPPVSPLEVGYSSLEAYERDLADYPPLDQQQQQHPQAAWLLHRQELDAEPAAARAAEGQQAGAVGLSADERRVFEKLLQFATRLYGLGQAEAAIETWREALAMDPHHPKLLNDLGEGETGRREASKRCVVDDVTCCSFALCQARRCRSSGGWRRRASCCNGGQQQDSGQHRPPRTRSTWARCSPEACCVSSCVRVQRRVGGGRWLPRGHEQPGRGPARAGQARRGHPLVHQEPRGQGTTDRQTGRETDRQHRADGRRPPPSRLGQSSPMRGG